MTRFNITKINIPYIDTFVNIIVMFFGLFIFSYIYTAFIINIFGHGNEPVTRILKDVLIYFSIITALILTLVFTTVFHESIIVNNTFYVEGKKVRK